MSDQLANCEKIKDALSAMFPDSFINVRLWQCLIAFPCIMVFFAVEPRAKWVNGIVENDPANCKFLIEAEGGKFVIGQPTMHFTNRFNEVGVKFRKLRADTEEQAIDKLVQWFSKNREAILSLKQKA